MHFTYFNILFVDSLIKNLYFITIYIL